MIHNLSKQFQKVAVALFGDLPSLQNTPTAGKPGLAQWESLPAALRTSVDRIAANAGKAIEAYERTLICGETRFDRWARGEGWMMCPHASSARCSSNLSIIDVAVLGASRATIRAAPALPLRATRSPFTGMLVGSTDSPGRSVRRGGWRVNCWEKSMNCCALI